MRKGIPMWDCTATETRSCGKGGYELKCPRCGGWHQQLLTSESGGTLCRKCRRSDAQNHRGKAVNDSK